MAVNLRGKVSKASKTVFQWLRRFPGPYWLTIVVIVIIVLLVVGAELLYAHTNEDKSFGNWANLLSQGAGLIAAGLILTPLIRHINKLRNQRMDFLYRIREAHVQIANAQRVIYADRSCTTYSDQMHVLMRVTPKLEDIERDIAATTDLFYKRGDKETIRKGIKEIVAYLDKGYDQYAAWCNGEDYETLRQRKPGWLDEFVKYRRSMPEEYEHALDKSKGTIRRYVYGGETDRAIQNTTLVWRFVDELLKAKNLNARNLRSVDKLLAKDFTLRLSLLAIEGRKDFIEGREEFKEALQHWRAAFPDWRISIERLTAEDDSWEDIKVVVRWTCQGSATTGKRVNWTANVVVRIENGRIAEITDGEEPTAVKHRPVQGKSLADFGKQLTQRSKLPRACLTRSRRWGRIRWR
jgi:ketosteroid isomerase-like protein